jgi:predicted nucleic acid-binding protein
MIPLRLVIDTNIVVSATLKPDGLQRTISDPILAEYTEVLARAELKIRKGLQRQLIDLVARPSRNVRMLLVPTIW